MLDFYAMRRGRKKKEEVAEDWCFTCKDGGLLIVCEYGNCLKAYHHECAGINSTSPDTNGRWVCGRHSCFICYKRPNFQCFCCPKSVCRACIKDAEFVHVKEDINFCSDCLKLVMLIEEEIDVDSDGEKVDFKDRDTYECLFKEYWEIIKKGENISLEDLRTADALLKNGENNADEYSDLLSDVDDLDYKSDDSIPLVHEYNGKRAWMKSARKLYDSRKVKFVGWGSKKLIDFLTSIGKNTDKPIPQLEVTDVIYDYIQQKKLIHPERKKKVLCDARLRCLFGRKSVNRLKISNLLDAHFAENQDVDVEDEYEHEAEGKSGQMFFKRQRRASVISETPKAVMSNFRENVLEAPITCHASITTKNMKLVYLRQSLIEELLKHPETFESKVIGSFVRIKCDPNDGFLSKSYFQLVQVTGVKRSSETYRIGEISTDFVFQVSNTMKDIRICMVSDGDFTEEECEDLHQRMKDGILKRPTLVEFEKKARNLHEDITNHWINRELALLQNLIDRANEKGWRRELFQYIERRQQLQTPSEQTRLLNELPKIVADADVELVANAEVEVQGASYSQKDAEIFEEGSGASLNQIDEERESEGSTIVYRRKAKRRGTNDTREQLQSLSEQSQSNGLSEMALDADVKPEVSTDSVKEMGVNEDERVKVQSLPEQLPSNSLSEIATSVEREPKFTQDSLQDKGVKYGLLDKSIMAINSENATIDLNQINEDLDEVNSAKEFGAGERMNSMEEDDSVANTMESGKQAA